MEKLSKQEDIVKFLFDTSSPLKHSWYSDGDFDDPVFDEMGLLENTTHIFNNARQIYDQYTERQFVEGLQYLLSEGGSSQYFNSTLSNEDRCQSVESMFSVFENVFAEKCKKSMPKSRPSGDNNLNELCLYWWLTLPRHGVPYKKHLVDVDASILTTMEKILTLNNPICVESAVIGMASWTCSYPKDVLAAIVRHRDKIPEKMLHKYKDKFLGMNIMAV